MTIESTVSRATYAGDGVSTSFAIPYYFLSDTDLVVTKTASGGGVSTLVLNVDYTLSGAGDPSGGTLTKSSALLPGETMGIVLDPPITQLSNFVPNQAFPSEAVELGYDKLTQIAQRVRDLVDRGMYAPDSDVNPLVQLPSAASRANKYPTFDASGNLSMATTLPSGTLSQATIGAYLYPQTPAEALAGVTPTNDAYPPLDMRRYGVLFDSNGTSGNGTDNTAAITRAVSVAKQFGGALIAPIGRARFTSPITEFSDTSLSTQAGIHGDSKYNTIFFADFTPVTRRAGFEIDNPSGNRMYWSFKNFRMEGPAGNKAVGIYSNFGSFLTEFNSLFFLNSWDGLVLANNFEQSIANVDAVCGNNGIQIGLALDNATAGRCNNVTIYGGDTTLCGGSGVSALASLNISVHGGSSEGNQSANYLFNACEGVVLSGVYTETDPTTAGTLTAQVYCLNCTAVVINGMTASAFKHGGEPVFFMEGCVGVTINGITIRTTGGPFNAVGLLLKGSTGVSINGSSISDCASSIVLDSASASELAINTTKFLNYTNSVVGSGAVAHKVQWNQAIAADVTASSFNAANSVDLRYSDNTKNQIEGTESFNITCTVAELNAGGKIIIDSILASERWRIIDIVVFNQTSFDAGGDRLIRVLDAVAPVVYTTVTAANLKAAPAVNRWGSAAVPFPATADSYTPTTAQNDLRVEYTGGTTNYATGTVVLTVTAMRTQ